MKSLILVAASDHAVLGHGEDQGEPHERSEPAGRQPVAGDFNPRPPPAPGRIEPGLSRAPEPGVETPGYRLAPFARYDSRPNNGHER